MSAASWMGAKYAALGMHGQAALDQAAASMANARAAAELSHAQAGSITSKTPAEISLMGKQGSAALMHGSAAETSAGAAVGLMGAQAGEAASRGSLFGGEAAQITAPSSPEQVEQAFNRKWISSGQPIPTGGSMPSSGLPANFSAPVQTQGIGGAALGYANSPYIPGQGETNLLQRSKGGMVPGQGSGKVDTVPAMLAPGEAVLNKAAAEEVGRGNIKAANERGQMKMGMKDSGTKVKDGKVHAAGGYADTHSDRNFYPPQPGGSNDPYDELDQQFPEYKPYTNLTRQYDRGRDYESASMHAYFKAHGSEDEGAASTGGRGPLLPGGMSAYPVGASVGPSAPIGTSSLPMQNTSIASPGFTAPVVGGMKAPYDPMNTDILSPKPIGGTPQRMQPSGTGPMPGFEQGFHGAGDEKTPYGAPGTGADMASKLGQVPAGANSAQRGYTGMDALFRDLVARPGEVIPSQPYASAIMNRVMTPNPTAPAEMGSPFNRQTGGPPVSGAAPAAPTPGAMPTPSPMTPQPPTSASPPPRPEQPQGPARTFPEWGGAAWSQTAPQGHAAGTEDVHPILTGLHELGKYFQAPPPGPTPAQQFFGNPAQDFKPLGDFIGQHDPRQLPPAITPPGHAKGTAQITPGGAAPGWYEQTKDQPVAIPPDSRPGRASLYAAEGDTNVNAVDHPMHSLQGFFHHAKGTEKVKGKGDGKGKPPGGKPDGTLIVPPMQYASANNGKGTPNYGGSAPAPMMPPPPPGKLHFNQGTERVPSIKLGMGISRAKEGSKSYAKGTSKVSVSKARAPSAPPPISPMMMMPDGTPMPVGVPPQQQMGVQ